MINVLKSFLRGITGRDILVLNPEWEVRVNSRNLIIATERVNRSPEYLPVSYNYHVGADWRFSYLIRGSESGDLTYVLRRANGRALITYKQEVQLPFNLNVRLEDQTYFINDEPFKIAIDEIPPISSRILTGHLAFKYPSGVIKSRTTGHRLNFKPAVDKSGKEYFSGGVYGEYDLEAECGAKALLERVEEFTERRGSFLDVGCATGFTVEFALNRGYDAEGVDFSSWAIEQANQRTGGRCRMANIDEAVADDFGRQYDVISMRSVIEHLVDPKRALQLLWEISGPGGVVYLETLNADSMLHRMLGGDWAGYTDYTHKSPWITADWLAKSAKETGFEILSDRRHYIWNENSQDPVWFAFTQAFSTSPLNTLLEDGFGDLVELILRKPLQ